MNRIGIVGSGTMATGIIQLCAMKERQVKVMVIPMEPQNPRMNIAPVEKALDRMVQKGQMTETESTDIKKRIYVTTELADLADSDLVIEAVPEHMETKQSVFGRLDSLCQEATLFASNTSSLSITEMASVTGRPDRIIGMHFFSPVPAPGVVEIIQGFATSDATKTTVMNFATELGKEPMEVNESPGFIVNRMIIPMINEATGILADGVAKEEDIDRAMKLAMGYQIGPLALGDYIGLDVCLDIMDILHQEFKDPKYRAHPLLRKMVRGGFLGRKSGQGFFRY